MKSNQERKTIRLITAGKGGSGKTTVSATLLSYLLSKPENPFDPHLEKLKIFVVDADPAETLAKPLGWEHHLPPKTIGELKDTLLEENIPQGFQKTAYVLEQVMRQAVAVVPHDHHQIYFAIMGHHQENSCMCAFNTAVNNVLLSLLSGSLFDLIIADKDAGVEHINRAVYNRPTDVLLVHAWPRKDYLGVAREIIDIADALGTTRNRLLVINNLVPPQKPIEDLLKEHGLQDLPFVEFPYLGDVFEEGHRALVENTLGRMAVEKIIRFLQQVYASN